MATLLEMRDAYDLEATSPVGLLTAHLKGAWTVSFDVDASRFAQTPAPKLVSEAQAAMRLLWVARIRAERESELRFFDGVLPERAPRSDPLMVAYDAMTADLHAVGEAAGGRIRVEALDGFSSFVVAIDAGVPSSMNAVTFARELGEATNAMIADQRSRVRELKQEVYGEDAARLRAEMTAAPGL